MEILVKDYMRVLKEVNDLKSEGGGWYKAEQLLKELEQKIIIELGILYFPLENGDILLVRSNNNGLYLAIQRPYTKHITSKKVLNKIKGLLPIEASILRQEIEQYERKTQDEIHAKWRNDASF